MLPFDQREGVVWMDGQIIPWKDAKVHVLTHALHYGSSVFEGIRIYNGKPFMLAEHIDRLYHSAKCLNFIIPFKKAVLLQAVNEQIQLNKVRNGYVRPFAWRGTETLLIGGATKEAHVAIAVWEFFEDVRLKMRESGARLMISNWRKPPANSSPWSAKAACIYTMATIIKNEATDAGFDDALMLDQHGNMTESTTSNLFLLKNKELHTPLPDCFLDGFTRQTVIKLAKKQRIPVVERYIKQNELNTFQAAFLTGTAAEIVPIKSIAKQVFDKDHQMIKQLTEDYSNLVKSS
jgi:branched-chain amino acid aminotransferase